METFFRWAGRAAERTRAVRCLIETLALAIGLLMGGMVWPHPPDALLGPVPSQVEVTDAEGRSTIDAAALLLEDPSGGFDLATVQAMPAPRWQRPKSLPVRLGYSTSVWWLRVRLHNPGNVPLDRRFEIDSPLQDYIDLWTVRGDGAVQRFARTGDRVPFTQRVIQGVSPAVPMSLAPKETVDIYLRLSTHDGLYEQLSLQLSTSTAFRETAQWHWFGSGLHCGVIGLLLIYSGLLFATTRDRGFALFFLYLCAQFGWRAIFSGDAFYILWPNHPVLNNQALLVATGAFFLAVSFFQSSHLRLREELPRCDRALRACGAASGLASLLGALLGSYAATLMVTIFFGMVWVVGITLCAVWLVLKKRHRPSMWMLFAWSPLSWTTAAYLLQLFGWQQMATLPTLHGGLQVAMTAQMLLMGLGLAFDVGRLQRAKFDAERAARRAHENLAMRLETEVRQRTEALEIANTRLLEMSVTDALTGLSNRRHFNELLDAELARQHRQGQTPALCLLDVDYFKSYNDLYGHQRGDAALVAIAEVLQQKLRRAGDRAFRVGGEEFALLLLPEEAHAQRRYVETIRAAIEALALPHAGNPGGRVTASFGLVQMPSRGAGGAAGAGLTAAAIYREADRLLYLAKAAGRNCIVSDSASAGDGVPAVGLGGDEPPSQVAGWVSTVL